jgi:hypothetical protein
LIGLNESGFRLILGHRPNSVRNFDWLPFTPPLVASSVLQYLTKLKIFRIKEWK